jgi:acyl carrier protein
MIEERIRRFIETELSAGAVDEPLSDDFTLLDHGVLDSLGLFQLVSHIEDEFGVEVADEELVPSNFNTIVDIARLVRTKRSPEAAP